MLREVDRTLPIFRPPVRGQVKVEPRLTVDPKLNVTSLVVLVFVVTVDNQITDGGGGGGEAAAPHCRPWCGIDRITLPNHTPTCGLSSGGCHHQGSFRKANSPF